MKEDEQYYLAFRYGIDLFIERLNCQVYRLKEHGLWVRVSSPYNNISYEDLEGQDGSLDTGISKTNRRTIFCVRIEVQICK